jgi:hypothetical protein
VAGLRCEGTLEGPGGYDDLLGAEYLVICADLKLVADPAQFGDSLAQLHRQIEPCGVVTQEIGHRLLARIRVGRRGKRHPGERVVLSRAEQPQRVPTATPRAPQPVGGFQHDIP